MLASTKCPDLLCIVLAASLLLAACHPSNAWKDTLKKADDFEEKKDFAAATKGYEQAVKEMGVANVDKKEELKVLNKLSVALLENKQLKEADEQAQKALSLAERVYGPDDINLMPHLVQIQRVAEALPDKVRVNEYMLRIIDVQEKRTGPESIPVMWLLDQYARSKSPSCGDSFDPKRLRQLVKLREKFSSPDNVDTVKDKMILAAVLSQTGEMKEALQIYADTLQTARKHCTGLLPELLLSYSKALSLNKEPLKAIELLKQAYEICKPGKSFNPIITPEVASDLGFLLEGQKNKQEAAAIYAAMAAELRLRKNTRSEYFETSLKNCQ